MPLDISFSGSKEKPKEFPWHSLWIGWGSGLVAVGGSVEARDPGGRTTMDVRRIRGIHTQQYGGRESGVKKTSELKNGVSETTRPGYGLGKTATNGRGQPRIWRSLDDRGPFGALGHPRRYSRSQTRGPGQAVIKVLHGVLAQ